MHNSKKKCTFAPEMEKQNKNIFKNALYRKWAYMILAILTSWLMLQHPVCNFLDDKGIIYIRSFSMTQTEFTVTQTELQSNVSYVVDTMSVAGLFYCIIAMIVGSTLCFLCFLDDQWRIVLATITAAIGVIYYVFLVYYILKMAEDYYATVYPNAMAILPAIVSWLMIFTRKIVVDEVKAAQNDEPERQWIKSK